MYKKIKDKVQGRCVCIVGAGAAGTECFHFLSTVDRCCIDAIMDNDGRKIGQRFYELEIEPVTNRDGLIYIIANHTFEQRASIREQLHEIGITDENIDEYHKDLAWSYWKSLPESEYKDELSMLYFETFGREMNWDNPRTYNEILTWEKIYAKDRALKAKLGDKIQVRDWVREKIGGDYLTELYGTWDDPDDIGFDALPKSFVLKLNNGSGRNIIVKNKDEADYESIRMTLRDWMNKDYSFYYLALHYSGIRPRILCEEYLEGLAENYFDYDIYCFHGEPKYIWRIDGSHRENCKAAFYDLKWEKQNFSYGYPLDVVRAEKPNELEMLLEMSSQLSQDFRHTRVDWYIMPQGRVYFSEITFCTWGGLRRFEPEEYDKLFGSLILEGE